MVKCSQNQPGTQSKWYHSLVNIAFGKPSVAPLKVMSNLNRVGDHEPVSTLCRCDVAILSRAWQVTLSNITEVGESILAVLMREVLCLDADLIHGLLRLPKSFTFSPKRLLGAHGPGILGTSVTPGALELSYSGILVAITTFGVRAYDSGALVTSIHIIKSRWKNEQTLLTSEISQCRFLAPNSTCKENDNVRVIVTNALPSGMHAARAPAHQTDGEAHLIDGHLV